MINLTSLDTISLDEGNIVKFLTSDSSSFAGFGEVYFSYINPQIIKGWKQHTSMTMNLTVVTGAVDFVFYDSNYNFFKSLSINSTQPSLLTVGPGYWLLLNVSPPIHL